MSLDIGTLVGYLDLDEKAFDRKLAGTDQTAKREGQRSGKSFGDEFNRGADGRLRDGKGRFVKAGDDAGRSFGDGFGRGANEKLTSVAGRIMKSFGSILGVTAAPTAKTVATAFSAQFLASIASALASGAVKVAHGLGAIAALAPAAIVATGLAVGAVKVALSGVGDALSAGLSGDTEAFNKALEGLSPSARNVARDVAGLRGELKGLKQHVQESLFKPLVDSVRPLADRYLPMIKDTLGGIAGRFGTVGASVAKWLTLPSVSASIKVALGQMGDAVGNVVAGLGNLVIAFLPLIRVGASFLPGLTSGFDSLTARIALFMHEAERTGRLREFISDGLSGLGDLIDTGKQIGRIFRNIGTVVSTAFSSGGGLLAGLGLKTGGLLDAFERLTSRAAAFVKTAKGAEVVGQVFTIVRALLNTLFGTFQRLAPIVGRVFGPILPQVAEFAEAVSNLASSIVEALEPAFGVLSDVIGTVLPPITNLMDLLARNEPVLQGIAIGIVAALVPAFISWAISAGAAAVSTLLLLAPLIAVGIGVAALAALVIIHFDTIKSAIGTAYNWVKDNWPLLLAILTGPIGLAVLAITRNWDKIKAGATAVKDWIVARWNDVLTFIGGLPAAIGRAASGMWDGITSAFKSAINALIGMWNDFKITYAGYDIPGPGPNIPGFTINTPNIPKFHSGGDVPDVPGGEMLAIVQSGERIWARNDPRSRASTGSAAASLAAAGAGSRPQVIVIKPRSGERLADVLMETIRYEVRIDGGDVQTALGA